MVVVHCSSFAEVWKNTGFSNSSTASLSFDASALSFDASVEGRTNSSMPWVIFATSANTLGLTMCAEEVSSRDCLRNKACQTKGLPSLSRPVLSMGLKKRFCLVFRLLQKKNVFLRFP